MSQVIERAHLFYCQGRSDKLYQIELIAEGNGLFHVVGYNGRRGAQLVAQPKTRRAVPYATARRVFDQLEQAKRQHPRTPYVFDKRQTFPLAAAVPASSLPAFPALPVPNSSAEVRAATSYQPNRLDALEF